MSVYPLNEDKNLIYARIKLVCDAKVNHDTFPMCSARIPGSNLKSDPRFLGGMIIAETENIPVGYSAGYLQELISDMIT